MYVIIIITELLDELNQNAPSIFGNIMLLNMVTGFEIT